MNKPTLVILAAGMGSRYGGLKQIDGVGAHNEPIIDFSIYDAYQAGFGKVVLIIKREHEELFRKNLTDRIEKYMEVGFAYQDMHNIPEGIEIPEGREKPWGTTHALLACKGVVNEPFAIINADDFYGKDAYVVMHDYLVNEIQDDQYAMVGYQCIKTLTEHGSVTRGVCQQEDGYLSHIVEIQKIVLRNGRAYYATEGEWKPLPDNTLVSMNFWGLTPKIFEECQPVFDNYLVSAIKKNPMKCEHVIPTAIGELVDDKVCTVRMLSSRDQWFGITYQEDKPGVVEKIAKMREEGLYPDNLWE
ncbi:MAG: nucleotidyltransferase [Solobacterium sp.]|nr:nucleotidyltransferase [Solobacterium sp.]